MLPTTPLRQIAIFALPFAAALALHAAESIEFLPAPTPTAAVTIIPVVRDATDPFWSTGKPTFEMSGAAGLRATGFLASTETDLLVRVDVFDTVHLNEQKIAREAWNGDSLTICFDGRGDGAGTADPATVGVFGPDDTLIRMGLTPSGPLGWAHSGFSAETRGLFPAELMSFTRDEAKHLTRYEVHLTWARYGVEPGVFPQFGLAVFVRNVDRADDREGVEIRWGSAPRGFAPGLLHQVALAHPPAPLTAIAAAKPEVWNRHDTAELLVAVGPGEPVTVEASDGRTSRTETIRPQHGLARRIIRYTPGDAGTAELTVKLARAGGEAVTHTVDLTLAEPIVHELIHRLQELAATSTQPLFTRHLRSLEAIVQSEWAKAATYKFENLAMARETLIYLTSLRDAFKGDSGAARAETYLRDGMPLTMAFRSTRDGTLQFYFLTLPLGFDPARSRDEQTAFPLFVELHGAGSPHPLNGPSAYYGVTQTGGYGYESATTYATRARAGYHVYPFARGNSRYLDIGEIDVWEALADFEKSFRADPERQYLFGFSMGGMGTWNLARQTPDRWAAVSIMGACPRVQDHEARNLANVPVSIWMGALDPGAQRAGGDAPAVIAAFERALKAQGATVSASTTPDVGHRYLGEIQQRSYEWLQTFTRRRPPTFSFTMDDERHAGVWGITLQRDLALAGLPRFACTIEGQTVRITTEGAAGISAVLGDEGLRMEGDVTLFIDGEQVYAGPATNEPIRLGG